MRQDARSLLFVYGTLKRGLPNHTPWLSGATFLGPYRTVCRYPLVLWGPRRLPALIDRRGLGHRVRGELFEVTVGMLERLDRLEGVAHGVYRREVVLVEPQLAGRGALPAHAYLRPASAADLSRLQWQREYLGREPGPAVGRLSGRAGRRA